MQTIKTKMPEQYTLLLNESMTRGELDFKDLLKPGDETRFRSRIPGTGP